MACGTLADGGRSADARSVCYAGDVMSTWTWSTLSRASCWWVTGHVMLMELDLVVNHLLVLWVLAALLWQMAGHR